MNLSELVGKRITGLRALPTITTALQSEQDVETLVVELEDGSVLNISCHEEKCDNEYLALDIKIK